VHPVDNTPFLPRINTLSNEEAVVFLDRIDINSFANYHFKSKENFLVELFIQMVNLEKQIHEAIAEFERASSMFQEERDPHLFMIIPNIIASQQNRSEILDQINSRIEYLIFNMVNVHNQS
jgi:hypothetical protein